MVHLIFSPHNMDLYHCHHEGRVIDITEHKTKIIALSVIFAILTPFLLGIGGYVLASRLLSAHYKWKKIEELDKQSQVLRTDTLSQNILFKRPPPLSIEETGCIDNGGNSCYLGALVQCLKTIPYFWGYLDESTHPLHRGVDETDENYAKRQAIRKQLRELLERSFRGELVTVDQINVFRQCIRDYDETIVSENGPEDAREVWGALSNLLEIPDIAIASNQMFVLSNAIVLDRSLFDDLAAHLQGTKLMRVSPIFVLGTDTEGNRMVTPPESIEVECEGVLAPLRYKLVSVLSCGGHATAHLRDNNGWVIFDDNTKLKVSEQTEYSKAWTTMVFYQLEEMGNQEKA